MFQWKLKIIIYFILYWKYFQCIILKEEEKIEEKQNEENILFPSFFQHNNNNYKVPSIGKKLFINYYIIYIIFRYMAFFRSISCWKN